MDFLSSPWIPYHQGRRFPTHPRHVLRSLPRRLTLSGWSGESREDAGYYSVILPAWVRRWINV